MNRTLYLIRIQPYFRFSCSDGGDADEWSGPRIVAAFVDADAARSYAFENVPIELSPFDDPLPPYDEDHEDDDDDWIIVFVPDDDGDLWKESRKVSITKLSALVREQGLVPAKVGKSSDVDEIFQRWWNANAPEMTEAQKTAIWRFLIPNLYKIIEVPLVSDTEQMVAQI